MTRPNRLTVPRGWGGKETEEWFWCVRLLLNSQHTLNIKRVLKTHMLCLQGTVCGTERCISTSCSRKNVVERFKSCLGIWSCPKCWKPLQQTGPVQRTLLQSGGYEELSKVLKPPWKNWNSLGGQTGTWRRVLAKGLNCPRCWNPLRQTGPVWRSRQESGGCVGQGEELSKVMNHWCGSPFSIAYPHIEEASHCRTVNLHPLCNWESHLPWIRLTGFLCLQTEPHTRKCRGQSQ